MDDIESKLLKSEKLRLKRHIEDIVLFEGKLRKELKEF